MQRSWVVSLMSLKAGTIRWRSGTACTSITCANTTTSKSASRRSRTNFARWYTQSPHVHERAKRDIKIIAKQPLTDNQIEDIIEKGV
eukprot:1362874-Amorphochlora_amoeboformis.AAC.1